jgi:hypothetical protein
LRRKIKEIYQIVDNLTKFIWVKNYTKTYKNKEILTTMYVKYVYIYIHVFYAYTREDCTAKIHEKKGKKSAKEFQPVT